MLKFKVVSNSSYHKFDLGTEVKTSLKGKHTIAYTGKFLNLNDKSSWWYIDMEDLEKV